MQVDGLTSENVVTLSASQHLRLRCLAVYE